MSGSSTVGLVGFVSVSPVGPFIPNVKVYDVTVKDMGFTAVLSYSLSSPFDSYVYRLSFSPLTSCCGARHVGGKCVDCDADSFLSGVHVSFVGSASEPFAPVEGDLGSFDECVELFVGTCFQSAVLYRGESSVGRDGEAFVAALSAVAAEFSELVLSEEFLLPWRAVPLSGDAALLPHLRGSV